VSRLYTNFELTCPEITPISDSLKLNGCEKKLTKYTHSDMVSLSISYRSHRSQYPVFKVHRVSALLLLRIGARNEYTLPTTRCQQLLLCYTIPPHLWIACQLAESCEELIALR